MNSVDCQPIENFKTEYLTTKDLANQLFLAPRERVMRVGTGAASRAGLF